MFNFTPILCITLFCNTNLYASTSLKDLFNDHSNTVDFTGDVIKVNS